MANSLKSQLYEIYMGRKKYSPLCIYINYTLKRCIKKKQCQIFIPCKSVLIRKVEL